MKISELHIQLVKPKNSVLGFASFVLDNSLHCSGIAIIKKLKKGYRLAYPKKGLFHIFYPINKEAGDRLTTLIIDKLQTVIDALPEDVREEYEEYFADRDFANNNENPYKDYD